MSDQAMEVAERDAASDGATSTVAASFEALNRNPWALFAEWLALAEESEINDPNAMALSTVDADGLPNVRVVLLKGYDERGFVFYTNAQSQKGSELLGAGKAAGVLHWKSLRRQVRFRGPVEQVSAEEADAYFQSRSRLSRVGAWASQQSRPLDKRQSLFDSVEHYENKFDGDLVPRPPHWNGFRVDPVSIEFWMDGKARLHDRIQVKPTPSKDDWTFEILYP
ncbi:MAG: pyridoxamine 5'-phosphate oxidase [Pseudomonadota bacterium]